MDSEKKNTKSQQMKGNKEKGVGKEEEEKDEREKQEEGKHEMKKKRESRREKKRDGGTGRGELGQTEWLLESKQRQRRLLQYTMDVCIDHSNNTLSPEGARQKHGAAVLRAWLATEEHHSSKIH